MRTRTEQKLNMKSANRKSNEYKPSNKPQTHAQEDTPKLHRE